MKVTIDEARVGNWPSVKIDGIELARIITGYTLHLAFGADLSEIETILENPNVRIIQQPEPAPNT